MPPQARNLPKIDAPKKPTLPSPSSSVANGGSSMLVAMTALGPGGGGADLGRGKKSRRFSQQHEPSPEYVPMERMTPKRRSL